MSAALKHIVLVEPDSIQAVFVCSECGWRGAYEALQTAYYEGRSERDCCPACGSTEVDDTYPLDFNDGER